MNNVKEAVKPSGNGVLLKIHVIPGSSQTVFPAGYNQWRKSVEIKVRSAAKDNKANLEVVRVIASYFNLSENHVVIISGQKVREKTIVLSTIDSNTIVRKLKESLHGL